MTTSDERESKEVQALFHVPGLGSPGGMAVVDEVRRLRSSGAVSYFKHLGVAGSSGAKLAVASPRATIEGLTSFLGSAPLLVTKDAICESCLEREAEPVAVVTRSHRINVPVCAECRSDGKHEKLLVHKLAIALERGTER